MPTLEDGIVGASGREEDTEIDSPGMGEDAGTMSMVEDDSIMDELEGALETSLIFKLYGAVVEDEYEDDEDGDDEEPVNEDEGEGDEDHGADLPVEWGGDENEVDEL